jgi:hypothetical protein
MSKQIIYLDELRKFINEYKISQKKVAELCEIDKTNLCLMLAGKLTFGEKPSKKGRAFAGTTEDRCKSILTKLVDYQINELELQTQYFELKTSIISDSRKELIDYKKTLEI